MRTIPASEIFKVGCALHGQPWSHRAGEDSLSTTDFRMVRSILSSRLDTTWHTFPWPVLVNVEFRRRVQKVFDYAASYVVHDQVFDPPSIRNFECVQSVNPNSGPPGSLPANWADLSMTSFQTTDDPAALFNTGDRVLNPRDGYIYYCTRDLSFYADIDQPHQFTPLQPYDPAFRLDDLWQTPMEEVFGVWAAQPDCGIINEHSLKFRVLDSSIRVDGDPAGAWFRYRVQCPVLTGDPWDEEASYSIGEQVYFTDPLGVGNFYDCLMDSLPGESPVANPLQWRPVEIPYGFSTHLSWAIHADWYELDGQVDKAGAAGAKAFDRLQLEFDKIERQQRQDEPWTVTTR
jgi:hypothetical protein